MQAERIIKPQDGPVTVYAIVPAESDCAKTICQVSCGSLDTVADGGFAAVVSTSGAMCGLPGQSDCGTDHTEHARLLATYQGTIDRIRRTAPLLPVKFGTSLPDRSSVRASLSRGRRAFADAFGRLKNCVQYEITVKWDLELVYAEVATEPAIARLKERSAMALRDDVWRAALGRLVKEALERHRGALAQAVGGALKAAVTDTILRPVQTDAVVLQMALLVRADEISVLEDCLEALQAAYGNRLQFTRTGPSLPYSFATVEISVVEPEALEQARLLFGLGPLVTAQDVRDTYRRLIRSSRPDPDHSDTGQSSDGRMMALLTEAYRLLLQQIGHDGTAADVTVSVGRSDESGQAIYLPAEELPRC